MKKKAIIVDLDGTLCNIDHRMPLFHAGKLDAFHSSLIKDPPNYWCLAIIKSMNHFYYTHYVTARPEKYKAITNAWLTKYAPKDRNDLWMRKDNDHRGDAIVKKEIYKSYIQPFYDVEFCIDDRQRAVDAWRELGLVCLQCAEGDY